MVVVIRRNMVLVLKYVKVYVFLPFTGFMVRFLSKININHATNIVIKARKG